MFIMIVLIGSEDGHFLMYSTSNLTTIAIMVRTLQDQKFDERRNI